VSHECSISLTKLRHNATGTMDSTYSGDFTGSSAREHQRRASSPGSVSRPWYAVPSHLPARMKLSANIAPSKRVYKRCCVRSLTARKHACRCIGCSRSIGDFSSVESKRDSLTETESTRGCRPWSSQRTRCEIPWAIAKLQKSWTALLVNFGCEPDSA
jgi:hypothetical protein